MMIASGLDVEADQESGKTCGQPNCRQLQTALPQDGKFCDGDESLSSR
jgi:hypothetical protein